MTIVGSVELPVVPQGEAFQSQLLAITTKAAGVAGREAAKTFSSEFVAGLKQSGNFVVAGMFAGLDVEASKAGLSSAKAFNSAFTESVTLGSKATGQLSLFDVGDAAAAGERTGKSFATGFTEGATVNGQTAAVLGNDAKTVAASEAAGTASGRAYARGQTAAIDEGNVGNSILGSFRAAESGAAASGSRAGILFASHVKDGLLPLAAVVAAVFSIDKSAKFDQQLALIQDQAGATAATVDKIGDASKKLAPEVGFGPTQLVDAFYHAQSAGFNYAQSLQLVTSSAKLADVGQANLEKTTQAVIATTASGIKGVSGFADAANLISKAVGTGDVKLPAFVQALSTGIVPVAKSIGLSFGDVAAAISTLTDNVVPANVAATRLRTSLAGLADPTAKQSAGLKSIGLDADSLATDFQKPDGLLVALQDLHKHIDEAFPASGGAKLSIQQQSEALNVYKGTLIDAGLSGTDLTKATDKYAASLANGTSNLVKQNQALTDIVGGGRTGSALVTLYEETDRYATKLGDLGTAQTRAQAAAAAWANQQGLLTQKFHDFTAGLDVGIIDLGHGLTPAVTDLLGGLEKVPGELRPITNGLGDVWDASGKLITSLEPLGKLVLEVFGATVVAAIDAVGFVLRDVVTPAVKGVTAAFEFFDHNKDLVIGLGAAIGTLLLPAVVTLGTDLAIVGITLAQITFAGFVNGIRTAGAAIAEFAVENPLLLAAAVTFGVIAAAVTALDHNSSVAKVDVDALQSSIKTLAETGSGADLQQGILDQIAKFELGSHHQDGIDYLKKYGVSAQDLATQLSDPANVGAFKTFSDSLNSAATADILGDDRFNSKAFDSLTTSLHSANPAVKEFATLFDNLEKDPSVNPKTILTLYTAFAKLSSGIQVTYDTTTKTIKSAQDYGKTILATGGDTQSATLAIIDATSKGEDAINKIDTAMSITTQDALTMIQTIGQWNDTTAADQKTLANAQDSLKSAQSDLTTKQQAYTTALGQFGAGSAEAKSAYADLQNAVKGVSDAQDAVNAAQPPSVQSILKKLGLDDASLKQLSGASSKLISEGISGPALTSLLDLNDPRAILAFEQGGKSAVTQLNAAVLKFANDSGPESFASLQTQYKKGGEAGVQGFIDGVHDKAQALTDEQNAVFTAAAGSVTQTIVTLLRTAGSNMPAAVAQGILTGQTSYLNQLSSTFTKPQQDAVTALEKLATTGGATMSQNLANAIETGKPIVISKQEALKDGINAQTTLILSEIGIHVTIDDEASEQIKALQDHITSLNKTAVKAGLGVAGFNLAALGGVAAGGPITGSGPKGIDTEPRLLAVGEHVLTDKDVDAMGGHGSVLAFRQSLHGMATGGPVLGERLTDVLNLDAQVAKVTQAAGNLGGAVSPLAISVGSGVARWIPDIVRVLALLNLPAALLPRVEAQMQLESGGNPLAINLWDSNAAKGTPSMGLMQTILPTFLEWAGPYSALGPFNGPADIYAGVNYAAHRYAGDPNIGLGYGHGYKTGGIVPGVGSGDTVPAWLTAGEGIVNLDGMGKLGVGGLTWLNSGKQSGDGIHYASGGVVTGAALTDLHKAAAEATAALKTQAAATNKLEATITKLGVQGALKTVTGDIGAGQKAIAAAVKEGNGPLQQALETQIRTAEGQLYVAGLAVAGGNTSPQAYANVAASGQAVTNLTAQLVKLNTVNTSLLDGLKTFASAQQQFRDSLNTTISTGAGFTDLLQLSSSPSGLQGAISSSLSTLTAFTSKIKQLKAKGYSDVIIRDVAADGIQNGSLYADLLLGATASQARSITSAYGSLAGAQLGAANSITALTEGTIPGITQTGAANYINTAIFTTTGGNVDLLLAKAEFAQRTGTKTFDSGGYLYPGRTVADNLTNSREKVLNPSETAAWESGMSGGGRPIHVEHHYNGVDLATAHAQSNRDLALALTAARVGG